MQYPPPGRRSPNSRKNAPLSLTMRLNRAANELNPLLMLVAVGLLILDVTFYLGITASHESMAWRPPLQSASSAAPSAAHTSNQH